MKFYDVARQLYLEINASGTSLGARLLQVRDGMNYGHDEIPGNAILQPVEFASKSLSSAEWHFSSIEHEALGILHRLEKVNHYCFIREVYTITNHKPLVAKLSKDVAKLSLR